MAGTAVRRHTCLGDRRVRDLRDPPERGNRLRRERRARRPTGHCLRTRLLPGLPHHGSGGRPHRQEDRPRRRPRRVRRRQRGDCSRHRVLARYSPESRCRHRSRCGQSDGDGHRRDPSPIGQRGTLSGSGNGRIDCCTLHWRSCRHMDRTSMVMARRIHSDRRHSHAGRSALGVADSESPRERPHPVIDQARPGS